MSGIIYSPLGSRAFFYNYNCYNLKEWILRVLSPPCSARMSSRKSKGKNDTSSWNHSTLYAGDSSALDFWVGQVMGGIASAARLVNGIGGSIYTCHRQFCWERGTMKWESTACFSSPRLPSGHFTPKTPLWKATCEEKLINMKQVESPPPPRPFAFFHINVLCPDLQAKRLAKYKCILRQSINPLF